MSDTNRTELPLDLQERIRVHLAEDHELDCPSGECYDLLCDVVEQMQQSESPQASCTFNHSKDWDCSVCHTGKYASAEAPLSDPCSPVGTGPNGTCTHCASGVAGLSDEEIRKASQEINPEYAGVFIRGAEWARNRLLSWNCPSCGLQNFRDDEECRDAMCDGKRSIQAFDPMLALIESQCEAYMESGDAGQQRMADRLLHIIRKQTADG